MTVAGMYSLQNVFAYTCPMLLHLESVKSLPPELALRTSLFCKTTLPVQALPLLERV
jgi:hypothetical protein